MPALQLAIALLKMVEDHGNLPIVSESRLIVYGLDVIQMKDTSWAIKLSYD